MADETMNVYDEDKAIAFIRQAIPAEVSEKFSDDDILFIIDTIWDYYESQGLTSLDDTLTEEEEADTAKLIQYVAKEVKEDGEILMDPADIKYIVNAELQYEETLDIFND